MLGSELLRLNLNFTTNLEWCGKYYFSWSFVIQQSVSPLHSYLQECSCFSNRLKTTWTVWPCCLVLQKGGLSPTIQILESFVTCVPWNVTFLRSTPENYSYLMCWYWFDFLLCNFWIPGFHIFMKLGVLIVSTSLCYQYRMSKHIVFTLTTYKRKYRCFIM